jgi:ketosteroid isomerase-like protein
MPSPDDEMSAQKRAVNRLLDGVARRDAELLGTLVHDDAQWWVPRSAAALGLERPVVGRPAVVALLSGTSNFFRADTTTWTVIGLIEEGSTVIAHVHRTCLTHAGNPYENEYLLRFDFRGDKIATAWEQTDTAYAHQAIAAEAEHAG